MFKHRFITSHTALQYGGETWLESLGFTTKRNASRQLGVEDAIVESLIMRMMIAVSTVPGTNLLGLAKQDVDQIEERLDEVLSKLKRKSIICSRTAAPFGGEPWLSSFNLTTKKRASEILDVSSTVIDKLIASGDIRLRGIVEAKRCGIELTDLREVLQRDNGCFIQMRRRYTTRTR